MGQHRLGGQTALTSGSVRRTAGVIAITDFGSRYAHSYVVAGRPRKSGFHGVQFPFRTCWNSFSDHTAEVPAHPSGSQIRSSIQKSDHVSLYRNGKMINLGGEIPGSIFPTFRAAILDINELTKSRR